MQIIVESILGKKSTVMAVESSDSVGSVKAKILVTSQHDWNLSNCMRLLFARDILVDAHTLGDYNIQDGSNVFVLRKCRDVACSHGKRRIDSIVAPNPPDVRSVLLAHGLSYGAHDDEVAIITAACKRLQHDGVDVSAVDTLGWTLRYRVRSTGDTGDWYAKSPDGEVYRSYVQLRRRKTLMYNKSSI
jgi:hypothetical protein